jgi:POT family proton-dependent oligopeptide transporter
MSTAPEDVATPHLLDEAASGSPKTDSDAPSDAPERPVPETAFEKKVGHPPGLFILFLTEMWERFAFYGMRGLLKGYMMYFLFVQMRQTLYIPEDAGEGVKSPIVAGDPGGVVGWHALQSVFLSIYPKMDLQGQASLVYGLYNGLVYLTPVFGGFLADKYFGQRKIVIAGGLLMAAGEFLMGSDHLFFFALMVLIIGNGAFKPNISTQVGNLYPDGDPRRDRAYMIFYVGINLGSFICNLICGTLAALYGWKYGFWAAGVGLLLGLVFYISGQKHLAKDNMMKTKDAAVAASKREPSAREKTPAVGKEPLTKNEKLVIGALIGLCALNVPFWAVYEQQGNTMQTWADTKTVWPLIGHFQVPTAWFQSFNPLMIMVLTPVINFVWDWQQKRGKEPSTVSKMAIGSLILGLSFILMVVGARVIGDAPGAKGSVFWPFAATMVLTIGELYLSPIGLSLVTKAAPKRLVSIMMGVWFVSSFLGGFGAGVLGVFYNEKHPEPFFWLMILIGVGTAGAMWAFNKPLRRILGVNA